MTISRETSEAGRKPTLTTANVNKWCKSVLADPARASLLKESWIKLLLSSFNMTRQRAESLSLVPPDDAAELQRALAMVVDHGGTIHIERKSERAPGKLVVQPKSTDAREPQLSVGICHCTFGANCRNWHCGWGPARLT